MAGPKLQIALYSAASCGGCDVAVLDTDEFILEVASLADIRLWPMVADGKYPDLERLADNALDVTLFNGAVRNSENEHLAKLLRRTSRILVAFGSCAHMGGIPGLANQVTREEIFDRAYHHNPSLEAGDHREPLPSTEVNGRTLTLPRFYERVYKLDDIVAVDYYVPGCPPAPDQVKKVIQTLASGALPPRGSILGASERAVCDDCPRVKKEKKVRRFVRPFEIRQDPETCLLEQGILCAGSVTRSGCGVRCPNSGMPCRGCYGPAPNVRDQGAKLLSAAASIVDSKDPEEIERILDGIPDFMTYAYRFGLPASLLQRRMR